MRERVRTSWPVYRRVATARVLMPAMNESSQRSIGGYLLLVQGMCSYCRRIAADVRVVQISFYSFTPNALG